jgi:ABC-type glycerol-3-phosphate transport system permease component
MSSGITRRLISYFIVVIIAFAIVMGVVFSLSYQRQTKAAVIDSLSDNADRISTLIETQGTYDLQQDVKKILENSLLENVQVWVVDFDGTIYRLTSIKMGMGMMRDISNLNSATQALIGDVLAGQEVSTDEVRGVFDRDVVTFGMPIRDNGTVQAALFVSASAADINAISWNGVRLMVIALVIGILIAILLGYFLSKRFVTPLQKANLAIDTLASGDYSVAMSPGQQR